MREILPNKPWISNIIVLDRELKISRKDCYHVPLTKISKIGTMTLNITTLNMLKCRASQISPVSSWWVSWRHVYVELTSLSAFYFLNFIFFHFFPIFFCSFSPLPSLPLILRIMQEIWKASNFANFISILFLKPHLHNPTACGCCKTFYGCNILPWHSKPWCLSLSVTSRQV